MIQILSDSKIIYPALSYLIVGLCFAVHNENGRFLREKQYGDQIEAKLQNAGLCYRRENADGNGNIFDFIVDDKIVLELKAKRLLEKQDFYQLQRHLQTSRHKLGLLVNFRNRYLKPVRIVRIDTDAKSKFV